MSQLLTNDERDRIKQEEVLRKEIRDELSPDSKKGKGKLAIAWGAINSGFGLWLLSAIFINYAGTEYSRMQEEQKEKQRRNESKLAAEAHGNEIYERISIEISYRYSETLARLKELHFSKMDVKSAEYRAAIASALAPILRPATAERPSLFPEYQAYSGLALVAEIRRHAKDGEKAKLKGMIARTHLLSVTDLMAVDGEAKTPAEAAARKFIQAMKNSKWDNGFAYTDCDAEKPFC